MLDCAAVLLPQEGMPVALIHRHVRLAQHHILHIACCRLLQLSLLLCCVAPGGEDESGVCDGCVDDDGHLPTGRCYDSLCRVSLKQHQSSVHCGLLLRRSSGWSTALGFAIRSGDWPVTTEVGQ